MDLPGSTGLPTLAFFDASGRLTLVRSGFVDAPDLLRLLEGVLAGGARSAPLPPARPLAGRPLTPAEAAAELKRLEFKTFLALNSNDGGFGTPARQPRPRLLLAIAEWGGAPERLRAGVRLTIKSALRGRSPRLDGRPLPDLGLSAARLVELSLQGPAAPGWRPALEGLPSWDPYEGLQDPHDFGVFRYAAGPGWYQPHFERRADDNLAWALLLRLSGEREASERILSFVQRTFARGELLDAHQRSDPFYYRLRADERRGVRPPPVDPLPLLEVQALAARAWPARCRQLSRIPTDAWPRAWWRGDGEDPAAPDAPPDAVGELLLALASCGADAHARAVAERALATWAERPLSARRLPGLVAGICAATPAHCARAVASVVGADIDASVAPAFAAFASVAR